MRDMGARVVISLALFAAGVALSTWWSSFLVVRAEHSLEAAALGQSAREISNQLPPSLSADPSVQAAIAKAVNDPSVEHAVSTSSGGLGMQALQNKLVQLDPSLAGTLHGHQLSLDTGQRATALAAKLRITSRWAVFAAVALGLSGLLLTTARQRAKPLHRIGRWAAWAGGLGTLGSWIIPQAVLAFTVRGTAHSLATTAYGVDAPARPVVVALLAGGALALAGARALRVREVGASKRPEIPVTPTPEPVMASGPFGADH
ncbi:MAG: hypothetical protein ACYDB3_09700 [Acidimicrobiales bacterium]